MPSRKWYLLSLALLVGSATVFGLAVRDKMLFVNEQIEQMPRFNGPTGADGIVITVAEPGKQNIFYENLGSFEGATYDTPRRQIWTTYEAPSMTCRVTHVDTNKPAEVRLPGVGEEIKKTEVTKDLIASYNLPGRQGHSAWVFDAELAGEYRVVLEYVDAIALDPADFEIPPELTAADKREMTQADGARYEADRRDLIEQASLASLEPIEVLFAVGPDPTRGSLFEVLGLKGAATVLAFGFTFAVLITLVVFMLRAGHVTPRGELSKVQRGFGLSQEPKA